MGQFTLEVGHYIICDPAYLIKKNDEGDQLNQRIIQLFFKDLNQFHKFDFDGIIIYMFRTEGGDGIFDGVGTDTGTIVIVETNQLKGDSRFRQEYSTGTIITFEALEPVIATVENFDLTLSNGIHIHTE